MESMKSMTVLEMPRESSPQCAKKLGGISGGQVLVGEAEDPHGRRETLGEQLGHRAAEAAARVVLLYSDDGAAVPGRL